MASPLRAALAAALAIGLLGAATAASADVLVNATTQRDNKADHDKWKKTEPAAKTAKLSSDDDDDDAPAVKTEARLSAKHKNELNGHLRLGDW